MSTNRRSLQSLVVGCTLLLQAGIVNAEPSNGWWWNPDESGRGFYLEARDGVMFLAGYLYADDGRAMWVSSGGPIDDAYRYEGRLQAFRNGQPTFGAYRPPDPPVDLGPITLQFADDDHGTIKWVGGTVPIERLGFGGGPRIAKAYSGWWWNPAESGSGYSIEFQGAIAFVAAFMYDDIGNPVWYLTTGALTTPSHYEGDWLEFRGGQTLTGAYQPPGEPTVFAHATIDFTSPDKGTVTFSEGVSGRKSALNGKGRSSDVVPLNSRTIYTDAAQWAYWIGTLTYSSEKVDYQVKDWGTFKTTFKEKYEYKLWWKKHAFDKENYLTEYRLEPPTSFTYSFSFDDTETGCHKQVDYHTTLAEDPKKWDQDPGLLPSQLMIETDLTYLAQISDSSTRIDLTRTETCPNESGGNTTTYTPWEISLAQEFPLDVRTGVLSSKQLQGFYPVGAWVPGMTKPRMSGRQHHQADTDWTLEWDFEAFP